MGGRYGSRTSSGSGGPGSGTGHGDLAGFIVLGVFGGFFLIIIIAIVCNWLSTMYFNNKIDVQPPSTEVSPSSVDAPPSSVDAPPSSVDAPPSSTEVQPPPLN